MKVMNEREYEVGQEVDFMFKGEHLTGIVRTIDYSPFRSPSMDIFVDDGWDKKLCKHVPFDNVMPL